ncbi:MAG: hypothetical protein CMP69_00460 [Flavobacteriales bacterium]|nr:hypothetical protein [Flavobacteriales bacterium]MBH69733.1 hypothetical protein [Flavobacteriales bacterium]|tara:strand:+ start:4636 stop:4818 length:183 start_codon:yes stop_codon:yes gene_type:complete
MDINSTLKNWEKSLDKHSFLQKKSNKYKPSKKSINRILAYANSARNIKTRLPEPIVVLLN